MKKCCTCKEIKLTKQFYLSKSCKDGFQSNCKTYSHIRSHEWVKAHPKRARQLDRHRNIHLRKLVLTTYGGCCACCGESHEEFLVIDHINGGGTKHRQEVGSGSKFYQWLKKQGFPSGFRVLCHNCNASLGFYKRCPHDDLLSR